MTAGSKIRPLTLSRQPIGGGHVDLAVSVDQPMIAKGSDEFSVPLQGRYKLGEKADLPGVIVIEDREVLSSHPRHSLGNRTELTKTDLILDNLDSLIARG
jgi:hypothetical protein